MFVFQLLTYVLFHGFITFVTLWFLFRDKATKNKHWVGLFAAGCLAIVFALPMYVSIGWLLLPIGLTIAAFSTLKLINAQSKGASSVLFIGGLFVTGFGILGFASFGRLILPIGLVLIIFSLEKQVLKWSTR